MHLIADVALRKGRQQLVEILIFFTCTLLEISKVVFPSIRHTFITSVCCVNALIYSKRTSACCANWIVSSVTGIYCMPEFLENNSPDFLDEVGVKIIQISSSRWWRFIIATSAIE